MRAVRSLGLRAAAVVAAAALMLVASACENRQSQEQVSKPQQSERIAGSMRDYAKLLLEQNGGEMGDVQKSAVERVAETGKVPSADYETGLSGFRQCMLDRGYKEIIFVDIGKGLKVEATHKTGTDAQEERYSDDRYECNSLHSRSIGSLFEKQVGNPDLIKDPNDGIAECLKREGLVDSSYTGKQYKKEDDEYMKARGEGRKDAWPYSFAKDDYSKVNVCLFANGVLDVDPDWPWEYIY